MANDQEYRLALEKYRDSEVPVLPFNVPVNRLIDAEHCTAISTLLRNLGGKWERSIATEKLGESLPPKRGLYMFVWRPLLTLEIDNPPQTFRPSWVLYVGKAGEEGGTHDTIQHRYVSEYSKYVGKDPSCLWENSSLDDRHARLGKYLSVRPLEYWFLLMESPRDIIHFERSLIKILNPPVNRQYGVMLRATTTGPA